MHSVTHLPPHHAGFSPRTEAHLHESGHPFLRAFLVAMVLVIAWLSWSVAGQRGDDALRDLRESRGPEIARLDREIDASRRTLHESRGSSDVPARALQRLEEQIVVGRAERDRLRSSARALAADAAALDTRRRTAIADRELLRTQIATARERLVVGQEAVVARTDERDRLRLEQQDARERLDQLRAERDVERARAHSRGGAR